MTGQGGLITYYRAVFPRLLVLAAPSAFAQIVRGDQLVAQSNYVSRQPQSSPQVSIIVRADFVLFSLRYQTGARSADERRKELERTFAAIIQRAGRTHGDIVIEVGGPGSPGALETASLNEVVVDAGDQSFVDLVLRIAVKTVDSFDAVRAEAFIADTPVNGRVEAVIDDSQFLGVADPRKHRETLIRAIADDVRLMQMSFGGPDSPVQVSLSGMGQRAQTRPVGPLDLEIWIPYSMSLVSGSDD